MSRYTDENCLRTVLFALYIVSKRTKLDTVGWYWPSKQVEALGEHKCRDIVGILPQPGHLRDKAQKSETVLAIPGRLATMYIYCKLLGK